MSAVNPCDPVDERAAAGVSTKIAIADPALLSGLKCEEASVLSREFFIPCGAAAAAVVWHRNDGKNTYLMCAMCAWHNVKNRGGRLLMATDARAVP
jgi:hypothetical protein